MTVELTLSTPALIFPAASLMLLVYGNRFLAVARLVRELHASSRSRQDRVLSDEIKILHTRLRIIRMMQALCIGSLFMCVLCMFLLFAGSHELAKWAFGLSLILFLSSLTFSFLDTQLSVRALNLHLKGMER